MHSKRTLRREEKGGAEEKERGRQKWEEGRRERHQPIVWGGKPLKLLVDWCQRKQVRG